MRRRDFLASVAVAPPLAACSSLKPPPEALLAPVPAAEHAATIEAMRPPKRARPVAAVLLDNRGSETTDAIVPWSVLTRSGVADVHMVSLSPGPAKLMPALTITGAMPAEDFAAAYPEGADYVIVPAYHHARAPDLLAFIRDAAAGGATIVGVCAGAVTVGHAGLLDGRRGTTHWFHLKELAGISPGMEWVPDRRYVADRGVVTTTGVSASLPVSLALVEAIAGPETVGALAADLGAAHHDARHDSAAFGSRSAIYGRGAANLLNLPGRRSHVMQVEAGVDEMTLALVADAWSRTYRGGFRVVSDAPEITTRHGLTLRVDAISAGEAMERFAPAVRPGEVLEGALDRIADRYGAQTARFVAHQLEVMWRPGGGLA